MQTTTPVTPSAILFDLDGTLIDSEKLILESWKYAHDKICPEIEWNAKKLLGLFGQSAIKVAENYGIPVKIREEYVRLFREYITPRKIVELFEDVQSTLDTINSKNIPMGLVTGARTKAATEIVEGHGLTKYFSVIVGGDGTKRGKPYADPIDYALKKLNIKKEKERIWFVGDSIMDLLSSKAAGVKSYLVWRKDESIPTEMKKMADMVIDNLNILSTII